MANGRVDEVLMLMRYKAWANERTMRAITALPCSEAFKTRSTRFGNIVHTMNHVFVVDDIFRHHVEGRPHPYSSRNTEVTPSVGKLAGLVAEMDEWWLGWVEALDDESLDAIVRFEFVGGGAGALRCAEIILHLVNHATYHRGFIGDMLYQASAPPDPTDFTVFMRDTAIGEGLAR